MKKILFCGGGSAGHVIPNIAVIECLKDIADCSYIGTDGIEKNICAENGVPFYECDAVKLVRGKFFCNLAIPFKLMKSIKEAEKIVDKVQPDLVFCKGGYASLPPAIAARRKKVPVITHESDVEAGLANKLIAKKCEKILTTFPSTAAGFDRGICTGSPMRKGLFNCSRRDGLKKFGLDDRRTLLVLGGGHGSVVINRAVRDIAPELCKSFNVLHICGKGNAVKRNIDGYRQIEFTEEMGLAYACADMAVSRCGSNAANELIALKIPTLFIPLENRSSRGDQVKNAEYFRSAGLCRIMRESELTPQNLKLGIEALSRDEGLRKALAASNLKDGNERIIKENFATMKSQNCR